MTFETFLTSTKDLCDKIAAKMISTPGGYWADGDAALTTEGNPPGRCLKFVRGGETLYFGLIAAAWGRSYQYQLDHHQQEGVLVFVSTGWDAVNHIPEGTIWCSSIHVCHKHNTTQSLIDTTGQAWMWYDNDGFTLLYRNDASGYTDHASIFVIERDETKEYADGFSNFYMFTDTANDPLYQTVAGVNSRWYLAPYSWTLPSGWDVIKSGLTIGKYVHPFGTQYHNGSQNAWEDYNNNKALHPYKAKKSEGNGKIYLCFGWCFNGGDYPRTPIRKFKTFFPVQSGKGLADGDIVNVTVGAETWQYIYKALTSPDGGVLDIALRYA